MKYMLIDCGESENTALIKHRDGIYAMRSRLDKETMKELVIGVINSVKEKINKEENVEQLDLFDMFE